MSESGIIIIINTNPTHTHVGFLALREKITRKLRIHTEPLGSQLRACKMLRRIKAVIMCGLHYATERCVNVRIYIYIMVESWQSSYTDNKSVAFILVERLLSFFLVIEQMHGEVAFCINCAQLLENCRFARCRCAYLWFCVKHICICMYIHTLMYLHIDVHTSNLLFYHVS